jgi:hypothetical protein
VLDRIRVKLLLKRRAIMLARGTTLITVYLLTMTLGMTSMMTMMTTLIMKALIKITIYLETLGPRMPRLIMIIKQLRQKESLILMSMNMMKSQKD